MMASTSPLIAIPTSMKITWSKQGSGNNNNKDEMVLMNVLMLE